VAANFQWHAGHAEFSITTGSTPHRRRAGRRPADVRAVVRISDDAVASDRTECGSFRGRRALPVACRPLEVRVHPLNVIITTTPAVTRPSTVDVGPAGVRAASAGGVSGG
jgi:hypothetical protein